LAVRAVDGDRETAALRHHHDVFAVGARQRLARAAADGLSRAVRRALTDMLLF